MSHPQNTNKDKMSPKTCYNCGKKPRSKAGKAKAALHGLLQSKSALPPSSKGRPVLCPQCKAAANRRGKVFPTDPLRCHVPYNAPASQRNKKEQHKIRQYIWGGNVGSGGEEDVLVNRVYSMLQLENSPALEYLKYKGCEISTLPPDVRRSLERVIRVQIRSLEIGVAY